MRLPVSTQTVNYDFWVVKGLGSAYAIVSVEIFRHDDV